MSDLDLSVTLHIALSDLDLTLTLHIAMLDLDFPVTLYFNFMSDSYFPVRLPLCRI
jgi:hypothetical protein